MTSSPLLLQPPALLSAGNNAGNAGNAENAAAAPFLFIALIPVAEGQSREPSPGTGRDNHGVNSPIQQQALNQLITGL